MIIIKNGWNILILYCYGYIYICIYILGFFNDGYLSFELDKDSDLIEEFSFVEMMEKVICIFCKNFKGFFLLVEGMFVILNIKCNILFNFSKIYFDYNILI